MDDDIAEKATSTSYRILETEVEVVPENVPAACTDENVNILSIKEELSLSVLCCHELLCTMSGCGQYKRGEAGSWLW